MRRPHPHDDLIEAARLLNPHRVGDRLFGNVTGRVHVLPPCGRCRELLRQVDEANLGTRVVLGRDEDSASSDLLPRHAWPAPLD